MTTNANGNTQPNLELVPVPGYIPEYNGICSIF